MVWLLLVVLFLAFCVGCLCFCVRFVLTILVGFLRLDACFVGYPLLGANQQYSSVPHCLYKEKTNPNRTY
jgi:hypothetical protein